MRRLALVVLPCLLLLSAGQALAQEMFPDVEYIAGKDGFADRQKGSLILGTDQLEFVTRNGEPVFSIPLGTITDVSQNTDVRDASVGKKLLFGGLAGSRKQEFVAITSETANSAEGIVFKVKQGTSPNVVAKIKVRRQEGRSRGT